MKIQIWIIHSLCAQAAYSLGTVKNWKIVMCHTGYKEKVTRLSSATKAQVDLKVEQA